MLGIPCTRSCWARVWSFAMSESARGELALVLVRQSFQHRLGFRSGRHLVRPEQNHHRHLPGPFDDVVLEPREFDFEYRRVVHAVTTPRVGGRTRNQQRSVGDGLVPSRRRRFGVFGAGDHKGRPYEVGPGTERWGPSVGDGLVPSRCAGGRHRRRGRPRALTGTTGSPLRPIQSCNSLDCGFFPCKTWADRQLSGF